MNIGELLVRIGAIGDSKKVKDFQKAVRDAGKAIENFDKGTNKSNEKTKKFTKNIQSLAIALSGAITVLGTTYTALDKLTSSLREQNVAWLNLTRQSNLSLETFQKWGNVGKVAGIDNLTDQIADLEQKIYKAKLLGEGYEGWALAGIMPNNVEGVMEQLRQRVKGLDNTQSKFLLEKMGLDPRLITVLRMERSELERMQQISNKYSLKGYEREDIEKMRREIEIVQIKLQYFKDKFALALLPIFERLAKSIANLTDLAYTLWDRFSDLFKIIALVVTGVGIKNGSFAKFGKGIDKLLLRLPIVGRYLGGISKLLGRISWQITAVLAVFALLEDLSVFLQGGDSLIGDIVNWFKEIGESFKEGFANLGKGNIWEGLEGIGKTLVKVFNDIIKAGDKLAGAIANWFTLGIWNKFRKWQKNFEQEQLERAEEIINNSKKKDVTGDSLDKGTTSKPTTLSPTAKGQLWNKTYNSNKTAYNTLNQTNYFDTSAPIDELQNQLLFYKLNAVKNIG